LCTSLRLNSQLTAKFANCDSNVRAQHTNIELARFSGIRIVKECTKSGNCIGFDVYPRLPAGTIVWGASGLTPAREWCRQAEELERQYTKCKEDSAAVKWQPLVDSSIIQESLDVQLPARAQTPPPKPYINITFQLSITVNELVSHETSPECH
jgi:hypothetical protein